MSPGDVVWVKPLEKKDAYALTQIPAVEGAVVMMDPHTGRVLAMSGGQAYSDADQSNRATQAKTSARIRIQAFVYLAALESGYTPATLVEDAPIVFDQGPGLRPGNRKITVTNIMALRRSEFSAFEKSRNLMTVRLAAAIECPVKEVVEKFGVVKNLSPTLAMSLGAGETTVLDLTTGYAMLVNGGKKITPTLLDRVQDRTGKTVFRHDTRPCEACNNVAFFKISRPGNPGCA